MSASQSIGGSFGLYHGAQELSPRNRPLKAVAGSSAEKLSGSTFKDELAAQSSDEQSGKPLGSQTTAPGGSKHATRPDEVKTPKQTSTRGRAANQHDENDTDQALLLPDQPGAFVSVGSATVLNNAPIASQQPSPSESAEMERAGNLDGVGRAQPTSGELALAMQVQSPDKAEEAPSAELDDAKNHPASGADSVISSVGSRGLAPSAALPQQLHKQQDDAFHGAAPVSNTLEHSSGEASNRSATNDTKSTVSSDFHTEFEKAQSEPVRGAHVQVSGDNNQKIDIRFLERAGTLSVTVRSADSSLARALQDHVPELTARLSAEHFHTETWTPAGTNGSGESPNRDGDGSSKQSYTSGQQGNPGERQGNKRNQHQPDWIDELEAHPVAIFRKG